MSPRLKLQSAAKPLLLAGAMWSAGFATPVGAVGNGSGRPQTPPPCGPDGVCIPNIPTYGWYQTRWRTFPGEAKGPTKADVEKQEEKDKEEDIGGPQTPPMEMEGSLTRERPKRGAQPGAEGGPAPDPNEDIRNLPGLPPLPGPGEAPPAGGAMPAPAGNPAAAPAGDLPLGPDGAPAPAGTAPEGGANPLDPFGAAPPTPPWLSKATMTNPAAGELVQLPYVEEQSGAQVVQPVDNLEPLLDGPNLHGEDAPPALPAALQRLSGLRSPVGQGVAYGAPVLPPAMAPVRTAMVQPGSVAPARRAAGVVQQASVVIPVGGQLVNPAGTMEAIAEDQGAQQAIYIEASDSQ
ncbi:MAG: hypothetical protein C0485_16120 [Pirellula sp.]|nr:hypothetical protein [Pirellula sp.]